MMQSIRRLLVNASALSLAAIAFACAGDQTAGPDDTPANQSSRGGVTAGATGLSVIPGALAIRVGESGSLTAALVDGGGAVVSVPSGTLGWTSSNPAVATVNGSGVVQGVATGEATVSVTVEGFSGSARVVVR